MRGGLIVFLLFFSILTYSQGSFKIEKVFFVDDSNWREFVDNTNLQPDYADVEASDMERLNGILNYYQPVKRPRYKMPHEILYGMMVSNSENYNIRLAPNVIGVYYEDVRQYYFISKVEDRRWLEKFIAKIKAGFKTETN